MIEPGSQPDPDAIWRDDAARAVESSRARIVGIARDQRERASRLEATIFAELERLQDELESEREMLSRREEQLSADEQAMLASRDRLAADQALHARSKGEADNRRAASRQRTAARIRRQRAARLYEVESLRTEAAQLAGELQSQLRAAKQRCEELENRFDEVQAGQHAAHDQTSRQALERIAELERQLASVESGAPQIDSDLLKQHEDLKRRYEMAVADVREMKKQVAALEAAPRPAAAAPSSFTGLDWESQKRRLLEALEADASDNPNPTAEQKRERLEMRQVIDATQAAVAEKEREIAEMREMLQQQSTSHGSLAIGAAMIGEMLDTDEMVRQERERLRGLQAEWEEKLRQAEIELSMARAKIARDRAEIDEKLRAIEEEAHHRQKDNPGAAPGDKPQKGARGRWRARLGLKDADE